MTLIVKRITNASATAMTTHLKLMRHCVSLLNNERTPALPSDRAVRAIAMNAGIKTITTGTASPGRGNRVAAKVSAMVSSAKDYERVLFDL